jgi:uncharacterized LabA/DUF88 family protein
VYEDNFDIAYLVSGDSDLVAPVKKVLALDKIKQLAARFYFWLLLLNLFHTF